MTNPPSRRPTRDFRGRRELPHVYAALVPTLEFENRREFTPQEDDIPHRVSIGRFPWPDERPLRGAYGSLRDPLMGELVRCIDVNLVDDVLHRER